MTRLQQLRPGGRLPRLLAVAVAAVALTALAVVFAGSARGAAVNPGQNTDNRPSMTEAGGVEYLAYADTTRAGAVWVTQPNSAGGIAKGPWGPTGSAADGTFVGTGPTIASVHGKGLVVAWTGLDGTIWVSELMNGSFSCISHPVTLKSGQTPYLSTAGDDGSGSLYLIWVDARSSMHVTPLTVPAPGQCTAGDKITAGATTNIAGETAWGGPAWVVSGYNTPAERFWLIWSGTNSGHSINVAEYRAFNGVFARVGKVTEPHYTNTDIGAAYNTSTNKIAVSYCGTDNKVYYQEFTTSELGGQEIATGSTCAINLAVIGKGTSNPITYYSGGVGINYDYSHRLYDLGWASGNSTTIQISALDIS